MINIKASVSIMVRLEINNQAFNQTFEASQALKNSAELTSEEVEQHPGLDLFFIKAFPSVGIASALYSIDDTRPVDKVKPIDGNEKALVPQGQRDQQHYH